MTHRDRRLAERLLDRREFPGGEFCQLALDLELLAERVEPLELEFPKAHVKKSVYGGDPVTGLLRAAQGASMLGVGDRSRQLPTRLLLGSASRGVLFEAGCPLAIAHGISDSEETVGTAD